MEYLPLIGSWLGFLGVITILALAVCCVFDFLRFIYDIIHDFVVIAFRELRRPN
jgi:hypothetical protein